MSGILSEQRSRLSSCFKSLLQINKNKPLGMPPTSELVFPSVSSLKTLTVNYLTTPLAPQKVTFHKWEIVFLRYKLIFKNKMKFYLQNIEDFAPPSIVLLLQTRKKDRDDQTGIKHLHLKQTKLVSQHFLKCFQLQQCCRHPKSIYISQAIYNCP